MQFALLLYGELSFDEEERVDAHLDGCAECRAALEREKSLHAAFDGVGGRAGGFAAAGMPDGIEGGPRSAKRLRGRLRPDGGTGSSTC